MNLYQLLLGPLLDTLNPQKEHFAQEDSPSNPSNGPRGEKQIRPYYEKLGDRPSIPASRPPSPTTSAGFWARTPSTPSARTPSTPSARTPSTPSAGTPSTPSAGTPSTPSARVGRSSARTPSAPSAPSAQRPSSQSRRSSSQSRRSLKEKRELTIYEVIESYIKIKNLESKTSELTTLCADKAIELDDIKILNHYVKRYDRELCSTNKNIFISKEYKKFTLTVRNFEGEGKDLILDSSNINSYKKILFDNIKENKDLYSLLEKNGHYLNPENPPKRQEKESKGR